MALATDVYVERYKTENPPYCAVDWLTGYCKKEQR